MEFSKLLLYIFLYSLNWLFSICTNICIYCNNILKCGLKILNIYSLYSIPTIYICYCLSFKISLPASCLSYLLKWGKYKCCYFPIRDIYLLYQVIYFVYVCSQGVTWVRLLLGPGQLLSTIGAILLLLLGKGGYVTICCLPVLVGIYIGAIVI